MTCNDHALHLPGDNGYEDMAALTRLFGPRRQITREGNVWRGVVWSDAGDVIEAASAAALGERLAEERQLRWRQACLELAATR